MTKIINIKVKEWIAKKYMLPLDTFEAELIWETDHAICIFHTTGKCTNKYWIAKTQIIN